MNYFVLAFSCIITLLLGFILAYLKKLSKNADILLSVYNNVKEPTTSSFDVKELTSYELERLEREETFDKRIASLTAELHDAKEVVRHGTTAVELHPLVHNLPHDAVQTKYDLDSYEEVAE